MNQTKRIPYVLWSLSIIIVILASTIYGMSPMQANAKGLADNSNAPLESITFAPKVDLFTGLGPTDLVIGDLDGDSKPDLVTANHRWYQNPGNTISTLRNTSTSGNLTFEAKVDFTTSTGPYGLALADIDGDNKLDVIIANYGDYASGTTVSVLRNTSTQGSISFATKVDFPVGNGPLQVAVGDLDGDGKPDLAVTNHYDGNGTTVTVLRNTSTQGNVSFSTGQTFTVLTGPFGIAIKDIDGDTKLDIVVANNGSLLGDGTTVSVLRNTSTLGNISFAPKVDFIVGTGPRVVAIQDLDGDIKPDVVVSNFGNYDGTTVSVLRNTSTSGSISFEPKVDFTAGIAPHGIAISDIDNDDKPDIVVSNSGNYDGTTVSVLRNTSISGSISFETKVDFTAGITPHGVVIGDFDGDDKPDLAVANYGDDTGDGNTISVLLNTITPNASIQGSVTLQGRPTPPDPRWIVPLRVKLTLPGQTTPIYNLTPTTDDSGYFSLSEITPGTYDVYVKNIHTLQNKLTIALVEGTNVVNFGTLKEGDANDNNFVNLNDFSILANTFSKCVGYTGYDGRADFNESGCVTLPDFSLLSANFLQGGQILSLNPESNITAPETPQAAVLIVVQPALLNVNVGDTFSVTIQIQSGSQLMNGAQASMDFDPDQLKVNKLTGNSTNWPIEIISQVDNANGTLDYAAGAFSNFPHGNVNLVVIQFEAIADTQLTPLTFHYGDPRNTDVTYGAGISVLTGDVDGQMQIGFFNKTNPANGATGVSISPTLSWTTSLGVTRYEYCLSTTNACSVWNDNGTATSVALSGLNYSTPYYWHVRAVNGVGSAYSDGLSTAIWSFTTQAPTDVRLANFNALSLPQGIQLNWQTAQENDLIGFNIYRSESLDGPQVQINYELIAAITPGELQGNDYRYLDTTAEVGKTYYYWVEWVGNRDSELFGPLITSLVPYHVWLPLGMK